MLAGSNLINRSRFVPRCWRTGSPIALQRVEARADARAGSSRSRQMR